MLGEFGLSLMGRIAQIKARFSSHESLTSNAHGATASPTALTLITRDNQGRAQVIDPQVAADIATKNYVDTLTAGGSGVTSVTAGAGLSASPSNPVTSTGTLSLAAVSGITPGPHTAATITLDAYGRVVAASSSGALTSLTHSAPISVTGSGNSRNVAITPATAGAAGSMSASDKAKLDAATAGATGAAIMMRDSSNQTDVALVPSQPANAASKSYVDSKVWSPAYGCMRSFTQQSLGTPLSGSPTTIVYDAADFYTGGSVSPGAGTFTTAAAGVYLIMGTVNTNMNSSGVDTYLGIYTGGTLQGYRKVRNNGSSDQQHVTVFLVLYMGSGNAISMKLWHSAGTTSYAEGASLLVARIS